MQYLTIDNVKKEPRPLSPDVLLGTPFVELPPIEADDVIGSIQAALRPHIIRSGGVLPLQEALELARIATGRHLDDLTVPLIFAVEVSVPDNSVTLPQNDNNR